MDIELQQQFDPVPLPTQVSSILLLRIDIKTI